MTLILCVQLHSTSRSCFLILLDPEWFSLIQILLLTQRFWQPCFQLAFSQQLDLHLTLSLVTAWTSQSTHFSLPYSNSLGFYLPATFIHSPGGTGCFFPAWNLSAMHCSFSLETVRGPYISLCQSFSIVCSSQRPASSSLHPGLCNYAMVQNLSWGTYLTLIPKFARPMA